MIAGMASTGEDVAQGHTFHQDGLTGFRALAAAWVMAFHLNAFAVPKVIPVRVFGAEFSLHPLLTAGWVGVDLFFVLSGFLLATHLMEALARGRPGALRRYFIARARRVFPAYWAQLLLLFVAAVWAAKAIPEWAGYIPLHIPMLHFVSERASFSINAVYWTLPIELSFYLSLPVIAICLLRAERRGGAASWLMLFGLYCAILVLVWCYRYAMFRHFETSPVNVIVWATSQLPGTLDVFMAGVVAATVLRWAKARSAPWRRSRERLVSTALAILGLAGIVGMMYFIDQLYGVYWKGHWALFVWHSITAVFIAMLVGGIAISGPLTRALFETRVMVFLGTISYSVYLWHYPIGLWAMRAFDAPGIGVAAFCALTVPLVLAASALSYYLVERPFLRKSAAPASGVRGAGEINP
ncbi:MAG: acyltransferase [Usitatibacter sp.]